MMKQTARGKNRCNDEAKLIQITRVYDECSSLCAFVRKHHHLSRGNREIIKLNLLLKFNLTISLAFDNPINRMVRTVDDLRNQTQSLNFLLAIVTKAGIVCEEIQDNCENQILCGLMSHVTETKDDFAQ